jgi:hypothetical protein
MIVYRSLTNNSSQVPVLETPDGAVFESNAIARYGTYIASPHSHSKYLLSRKKLIVTISLCLSCSLER